MILMDALTTYPEDRLGRVRRVLEAGAADAVGHGAHRMAPRVHPRQGC